MGADHKSAHERAVRAAADAPVAPGAITTVGYIRAKAVVNAYLVALQKEGKRMVDTECPDCGHDFKEPTCFHCSAAS